MRIYLDHNAGAPLRPEVREALTRFAGTHGNPASVHHAGQAARRELELARERIGRLINAAPRALVFTSGGTEANNLAIFSALEAQRPRRRIVTTAIEHSSILAPLAELERRGFEIVRLGCDENGCVAPTHAAAALDATTALVTIGLANNEVGTVQEIGSIGAAARHAGALFHLDAAQAIGRIPLDVAAMDCDLMTLSGHKIGAPGGIGALYIRPDLPFPPQMFGGPQEGGRRAGTPNLLGAIAFGAAADGCRDFVTETARLAQLASDMFEHLSRSIPGLRLNGAGASRLPNTLNLTFPGVMGETLLIALDLEGVEVSMGSACAAGAVEASHVLLAMGRSAAEARSSLRISMGWSTTAAEVEHAAATIVRVWSRLTAAAEEAA